MKLNVIGLILWAWSILGEAVEGFAHGAIIGTGISAVEPAQVAPGSVSPFLAMMLAGGALGAVKQGMIYIGSHQLPPILVASPSTPVSQP